MAMAVVHILLLPSWYPSHPGDVNGVFFREQAIALAGAGCQVGVLAANLRSIKQWRQWRLTPTKPKVSNDHGVDTLLIQGTNWFPRLPWLSGQLHVRLLEKLFIHYCDQYGQPDVIHVHSMLPAGLGALRLAHQFGIPYVITEHSTAFARGLLSSQQVQQAGEIAQAATQRWAVSTPFARMLEQKLQMPSCQWQTLPNMVAQSFLSTPLPQRDLEQFVFLNICLHTPNKNVHILLRAFAQRFKGAAGVELHLGGHGPQTEDLVDLAHRLGISSQVQFLGLLSRDHVRDAMARAHAFVLASQVETFGVVLIEALAMGLPLVATRCGGPEDIVTVANGLLVPPGDADQLGDAMAHVMQHASSYEPEQLRRDCVNRFSEHVVTRHLLSAYSSVIKHSPNPQLTVSVE